MIRRVKITELECVALKLHEVFTAGLKRPSFLKNVSTEDYRIHDVPCHLGTAKMTKQWLNGGTLRTRGFAKNISVRGISDKRYHEY